MKRIELVRSRLSEQMSVRVHESQDEPGERTKGVGLLLVLREALAPQDEVDDPAATSRGEEGALVLWDVKPVHKETQLHSDILPCAESQ